MHFTVICSVFHIDLLHNSYYTILQCGASILSEGVVLTAAHCVKGLGRIFHPYSASHHQYCRNHKHPHHHHEDENPPEAEQLVVRCGEWNTHHENEPLKHQVFFFSSFPPCQPDKSSKMCSYFNPRFSLPHCFHRVPLF